MTDKERLELLEEEQKFPYFGVSLEDSRLVRYLLSNINSLSDGKIIKMSVSYVPDSKCDREYINVNGLFAGSPNKSFYGNLYFIKRKNNIDGFNSYITVINEETNERKIVQTEFLYFAKSIKVSTIIDDKIIDKKEIPYPKLEIKREK